MINAHCPGLSRAASTDKRWRHHARSLGVNKSILMRGRREKCSNLCVAACHGHGALCIMGGRGCCQHPAMMGKFCAGAGSESGGVQWYLDTSNTCSLHRDISDDLHLGFLESKMFGQAKFGAIWTWFVTSALFMTHGSMTIVDCAHLSDDNILPSHNEDSGS